MTNCRYCGAFIPESQRIYITSKGRRYVDKQCAACKNARYKAYRERGGEAFKAKRREYMREYRRQRPGFEQWVYEDEKRKAFARILEEIP